MEATCLKQPQGKLPTHLQISFTTTLCGETHWQPGITTTGPDLKFFNVRSGDPLPIQTTYHFDPYGGHQQE